MLPTVSSTTLTSPRHAPAAIRPFLPAALVVLKSATWPGASPPSDAALEAALEAALPHAPHHPIEALFSSSELLAGPAPKRSVLGLVRAACSGALAASPRRGAEALCRRGSPAQAPPQAEPVAKGGFASLFATDAEIADAAAAESADDRREARAVIAEACCGQLFVSAVAHVLHVCLGLAKDEKHACVEACETIRCLVEVLPGDVVARFLPGIVGGGAAVLSRCRLGHSGAGVAALGAVLAVVERGLLGVGAVREEGGGVEGIVRRMMGKGGGGKDGMVEEGGQGVDEESGWKADGFRSPEWAAEARGKVSVALTAVMRAPDGVARHDGVWVRYALAGWCARLCVKELGMTPGVVNVLLDALATLCEEDIAEVAVCARSEFDALIAEGHVGFSVVKDGMARCVEVGLGGGKEDESDGDLYPEKRKIVEDLPSDWNPGWLARLDGYVLALVRSSSVDGIALKEISQKDVGESNLAMNAVSFFDAPQLADLLSFAFEVSGLRPVRSGGRMSAASTAKDAAETCYASPAHRHAVSICFALGSAGALTLLHAPLMEIASPPEAIFAADSSLDDGTSLDTDSLRHRYSGLCALEQLVTGAIHGLLLLQVEKADCHTLELLGALAALRVDHDFSAEAGNSVSSSVAVRVKLASLESIASVFTSLVSSPMRLRYSYSMEVVLSLVRDMAVGDGVVKTAARDAADFVAECYGFSSWRPWVLQHVNFVMGRILPSLDRKWAGPTLQVVIGNVRDDLSVSATLLAESTLRTACDELGAASDHRALGTLSAVNGVLSAALSPLNDGEKREASGRGEEKSTVGFFGDIGETVRKLRKSILVFCTEEVEDVGEERELPETDKVCGDGEHPNQPTSEFQSNDLIRKLSSSALAGCADLLIGRPEQVRAAALRCALSAIRLLSDDQTTLLPHIAILLPLLPSQFVDAEMSSLAGPITFDLKKRMNMKRRRGLSRELARAIEVVEHINGLSSSLQVMMAGLDLLAALVRHGGSFVEERFVRLIFPSLEPLLEVASVQPLLEETAFRSGKEASSLDGVAPSYAAKNAGDAALRCITEISCALPGTLKVFVPRLIALLAPYQAESLDHEKLRENLYNRITVRYEKERWFLRNKCAGTIVRALESVFHDEVWFCSLQQDKSHIAVLRKPHRNLSDICVRLER